MQLYVLVCGPYPEGVGVCRMIVESEQRRREMARVYNSYRAARSKYSIEDIPLPDASEGMCVCALVCDWVVLHGGICFRNAFILSRLYGLANG